MPPCSRCRLLKSWATINNRKFDENRKLKHLLHISYSLPLIFFTLVFFSLHFDVLNLKSNYYSRRTTLQPNQLINVENNFVTWLMATSIETFLGNNIIIALLALRGRYDQFWIFYNSQAYSTDFAHCYWFVITRNLRNSQVNLWIISWDIQILNKNKHESKKVCWCVLDFLGLG